LDENMFLNKPLLKFIQLSLFGGRFRERKTQKLNFIRGLMN